jgi:hypothetical protein
VKSGSIYLQTTAETPDAGFGRAPGGAPASANDLACSYKNAWEWIALAFFVKTPWRLIST